MSPIKPKRVVGKNFSIEEERTLSFSKINEGDLLATVTIFTWSNSFSSMLEYQNFTIS